MTLADRRCIPLKVGTPKLTADQANVLLLETPEWRLEGDSLVRTLTFPDFRAAMRFVNALAELAEAEDHHPDFTVRYSKVEVSIWTHTVSGLSENDFILAAKLDRIVRDHLPIAAS
jgi:4a-hydroxytetrahydrobiopterin dehydratase